MIAFLSERKGRRFSRVSLFFLLGTGGELSVQIEEKASFYRAIVHGYGNLGHYPF
jgi:hypothetical protein